MTGLITAMAQAPGGGGQGGGGMGAFLPMILIFLVLYFLILRPQARRQKEHQKMLGELNKGDRIVTTGGIHAVILKVNEKTIVVKAGDDLKLEIDRGAVARKLGGGDSS